MGPTKDGNVNLMSTKLTEVAKPKPIVIPPVPIPPVWNPTTMKEAMLLDWKEAQLLGGKYHQVDEHGKKHKHIHIQRGSKVLGVAHLDTKLPFKNFWLSRDYVGCQTIDNHLGLWTLMYGLPAMGITVDLLLCDEEETGCSTSQDFVVPEGMDYNWMVSFDRTGIDCALYQYNLPEFVKILAKYDIEGVQGAYSDIDSAGHLGILGMNMGCGMYDYHGPSSYASLWELGLQMRRFYHFHEAYKDIKLAYAQPQWKAFHRTRAQPPLTTGYVGSYKGEQGQLYEDAGFRDEEDYYAWLLQLRKENEQTRKEVIGAEKEVLEEVKKKRVWVSEADRRAADTLYEEFQSEGRNSYYFGKQHPVAWCSLNALPQDTKVGPNALRCATCGRKWATLHTRWSFSMKEDYCRYCYCCLLEVLGVLNEDWFDYAITPPGRSIQRRRKRGNRNRKVNPD